MPGAVAEPPRAEETISVKGTPVHALVDFVNKRLTAAQKAELIRRLPPPAADIMNRHVILPLEMFPVTALNRITQTAAEVSGVPVEVFAREAGRAAADEAVHGIWRLAASVLTPKTLIGKGSKLWSTVYSHGRLAVEEPRTGDVIITLEDFPTERAGCTRISGWFERLFEVSRARNVHIQHTECYSHGAPACRWIVHWE